jgi:hypothetical protein
METNFLFEEPIVIKEAPKVVEHKTRPVVTDYLKAGKVTLVDDYPSTAFLIATPPFSYGLTFYVYTGAYGNCQNSVVRYSSKIINGVFTYREFKDVLLHIVEHTKKKVIIFDIKEVNYTKLLELIEGYKTEEELFLVKQKYTNLTNSIMYCLYINTNNL